MSILIKGMDMPTEGTVIAIYKLKGKFYASVHGTELCPIVSLPPHGRLIDETDLNMQIHTAKEIHANEKLDFCNAFDSNGHVCTEWWCVEDMIENSRTIIPAEWPAEWGET